MSSCRGYLLQFAVILALAFWRSGAIAHAEEVRVCADCPIKSIGTALRMAKPRDRIVVESGIYREGPLIVDKQLALIGEGNPVLDGENKHQILTLKADGIEIEGFTLQNSGTSSYQDIAAIKVENVERCRIERNTLLNNFFAILVEKSTDCEIKGNTIRGPGKPETYSGNGIHCWDSSAIRIEKNRISWHRDGIYLEFMKYGKIVGNESNENARYGLHFMYSRASDYNDNIFRDNGAGVAVMYSKQINMKGNLFEKNWGSSTYGLLLKDMDDSFIVRNRFIANSTAIFLDGANRMNIGENEFIRNGWAVRLLTNSMGVAFMHNNFIENTFDVATSGGGNFNSFLENYWSRYRGYDLDRDGAGDIPYRPVSLFSVLTEASSLSMILIRSPIAALLDFSESLLPSFTPKWLADHRPRLKRFKW